VDVLDGQAIETERIHLDDERFSPRRVDWLEDELLEGLQGQEAIRQVSCLAQDSTALLGSIDIGIEGVFGRREQVGHEHPQPVDRPIEAMSVAHFVDRGRAEEVVSRGVVGNERAVVMLSDRS
jgi:hypothetical protein